MIYNIFLRLKTLFLFPRMFDLPKSGFVFLRGIKLVFLFLSLVSWGGCVCFFFLMIRRTPRAKETGSSAASDVYKGRGGEGGGA